MNTLIVKLAKFINIGKEAGRILKLIGDMFSRWYIFSLLNKDYDNI